MYRCREKNEELKVVEGKRNETRINNPRHVCLQCKPEQIKKMSFPLAAETGRPGVEDRGMTFVTVCTDDRKESAWEEKPGELQQSADSQPAQQSASE